jgi:hypothetical protein
MTNISSTNPVLVALTAEPKTASAIASEVTLSDSYVRETLSKLVKEGKAVRHSGKPATFTAAAAEPAAEEASAEEPVDFTTDAFEPAGEAGTFLGDSAVREKETGHIFNKFTGERLPTAEKKPAGGKRKMLNPQYKINQKKDAVQAVGGDLQFDKSDRMWLILDKNNEVLYALTAVELAAATAEELAGKVPA